MEAPKAPIELGEYERELLKNFDNEEKELLICKHCGHLLNEIVVRRMQYVYESYTLNQHGIEYNDYLTEDYVDNEENAYYCRYCDNEIDNDQLYELIDRDLFNG